MNWGLEDTIIFGALLIGTFGALKLAMNKTANRAYRAGAALALVTSFLLIWLNLAVGIIGPEDNPINKLYFGVLATGATFAIFSRFQPRGMARAMIATALAQVSVAVIAQFRGEPAWILTGIFMTLWLGSAWLFRKAS